MSYSVNFEQCPEFSISGTQLSTIFPKKTYLMDLISRFRKLIISRDAYWKIAGEQMGLEKPWEPIWTESNPKYTIAVVDFFNTFCYISF